MNCIKKKCAITNDDERMITCWLCNGLCHIKCSGLSVHVADSLVKDNGLHWCCNSCRKIGVTFYRFFQGNKTRFSEIQDEANKLLDRISSYGKLFEDFKSLDSIKSPVQSSPKRRKSSRINNQDKQDDLHTDSSKSDAATSSDHCIPLKTSVSTSSQNPTMAVRDVPLNNDPLENPVAFSSSIDNNPATNYAEVLINNGNNPSSHRELRVVPPKKQIFISRFAFDTSADDIDFYIKSKLKQNANITVRKFTYAQTRSITSFKITVPFNIFDRVVDPSFWPNHVIVREYEYNINQRGNNIVHLPPRQLTSQKN